MPTILSISLIICKNTLKNLIIARMTKDERLLYEKSHGYKSFGRLCDEFYQNIDPEEFMSSRQG